ncbi:MAG: hypothetical protein IKN63_01880 [Bacilli bacterium]|nr:hypothetical protein [Bacilli bacterium]
MMTYIYDILLNFNDEFYEFYEWEKKDNIYHIKKIPVFKVDTLFMENLLENKIEISNDFLNIINNKTEVFEGKKIKLLKYSCLFTDSYKVVGINIEDNSIKLSDLLLDEALDTLEITKRLQVINISYNIIKEKNISYFETRNELKIKNSLLIEFNNIYKNKDDNKLKYLYFEYFNKSIDDIDLIYIDLINSLQEINSRHLKLFELLKLCNKRIRNLTK